MTDPITRPSTHIDSCDNSLAEARSEAETLRQEMQTLVGDLRDLVAAGRRGDVFTSTEWSEALDEILSGEYVRTSTSDLETAL